MENEVNDFIRKRKRKKLIKRYTLFVTFAIIIIFLLMTNLSIFNVKTIEYRDNILVKDVELDKLYSPIGKNIFLLNGKEVKNAYKKNPYIEDIKIKRVYPDKIVLDFKEKNATYYIKNENKYYVLSDKLVLLEVRNNIDGLNLVETINLDVKDKIVGNTITESEYVVNVASEIAEIMSRNISNIKFNLFDFSNSQKIIVYHDGIEVILGDINMLEEKLNKSINIIEAGVISTGNGYINIEDIKEPIIYTNEEIDKEDKKEDTKTDENKN